MPDQLNSSDSGSFDVSMESTYTTPLTRPVSCRRRRAMSPNTPVLQPSSTYSSPYQIVEIDLTNSEGLKSQILEQDQIIQDQRKCIQELNETITCPDLNSSIIIESTNKISTQETRIFRRDVQLLRQEIQQLKDVNRELQDEMSKRNLDYRNLDDAFKKKEMELSELQAQLIDVDAGQAGLRSTIERNESLIEELRLELTTCKKVGRFSEAALEDKLAKYKDELREERIRNSDLCKENVALSHELSHIKKRCHEMEIIVEKDKAKESVESLLLDKSNENSSRLINEIKTLITIPRDVLTSNNEPALLEQIGSLKTTIKYLEEKITQMQKELEERTSEIFELDQLRKRLEEVEGDKDLTNKYLMDEVDKTKQKKAEIRCDLLHMQRENAKLKEDIEKMKSTANSADNVRYTAIEAELTTATAERARLECEIERLEISLHQVTDEKLPVQEQVFDSQTKIAELQDELHKTVVAKERLKSEVSHMEAKLRSVEEMIHVVDEQCEQYREKYNKLKTHSEERIRKLQEDLQQVNEKNRELERKLESQRSSDAELAQLRSEKDRLVIKVRYLSEELQEVHRDYREELAVMAREISDSKMQMNDSNRSVSSQKVDELERKLKDNEAVQRLAERQFAEITQENTRLIKQAEEAVGRETKVAVENTKLRQGLSDAVFKLEEYKRSAENHKELSEGLAEQLAEKEEKLGSTEDEISELERTLEEKDKLVTYLQSQINAKQVPKVGRRSTLLRIPSDTSMHISMNVTEVVDPAVVEELENEKMILLRQLQEKKKRLYDCKDVPPIPNHLPLEPSAPPRTPLSERQLSQPLPQPVFKAPLEKSKSYGPSKGTMRHDIPHRWKDLRRVSLHSVKCGVCYVGIPSFGKARRCTHCDIIVHCQCSNRVVNTCGLPDQCANLYVESQAPLGKMNGWIKIFRDDLNLKDWISAWCLMDEKYLSFYDNEGVQGSLSKPFLKIDLCSDQFVVRAGCDVPVEVDQESRISSVIHLKMNNRNLYLVAPSISSAKRWTEALQGAQQRRAKLTRRVSSFSDQSCILALPTPNNLTIHTACAIDDIMLIGAQSGLFFTSISTPRIPVRIGGVSSVTAMEVMTDLNMVALIAGPRRQLVLVPLSTLKTQLSMSQPCISPDAITGLDHIHLLIHHQKDGHRYLCAAETTKIHILKYAQSRDVFISYHSIATSEPAMCMQSVPDGIYFGADSFYFAELGRDQVDVRSLAPSHVADYPTAILPITDGEVLLAYQNYGVFVNKLGEKTRASRVEWEQMPMEFVYTAPYLFVVHYDSVEIMCVAENTGIDSETIMDEREIFDCQNAHVIGQRPNGDVFMSISSEDTVELHRFNATNQKKNPLKRKGISISNFEKRVKT